MTDLSVPELQPAIAVIHPCRLFSEGLASILRQTPYKLVFQSETFEAIPVETLQLYSRLVFLVGGTTSAQIERAVRVIRGRLAFAHVLVVGSPAGAQDVMAALEAGADGYLRETTTSSAFITAIELILRGETILPSQFVKAILDGRTGERRPSLPAVRNSVIADEKNLASTGKRLSAREESILLSLVGGEPNKVIAQKLSITEATVKLHVKAILRKIRVKNRTQAAIWAARNLPQNPSPIVVGTARVAELSDVGTE